jgi:Zn-dependent protease with chaperone function
MFAKPLILISVYILTLINFLILFFPFILAISPLALISEQGFVQGVKDMSYISILLISIIMIIFLFLDLIFGFTVWSLTKKTKPIKKHINNYPFIPGIINSFNELQEKFKQKNIRLLISDSGAVNAYAVGSLRSKTVVLTKGILAHIKKNSTSDAEFQIALKAILAHEISHLINKDFLPTLLLIANQKATNILEKLLHLLFSLIIGIFRGIPIIGDIICNLIHFTHWLVTFTITFFQKFIIMKIFDFFKLHVSRSTEYRCDYQAALACGGAETAFALSYLGGSGYVTIFSTHPRTESRMKYVKNVQKTEGHIGIPFINRVSNFISIFALFIALYFSFDYVSQIEYLKLDIKYLREFFESIKSNVQPLLKLIK